MVFKIFLLLYNVWIVDRPLCQNLVSTWFIHMHTQIKSTYWKDKCKDKLFSCQNELLQGLHSPRIYSSPTPIILTHLLYGTTETLPHWPYHNCNKNHVFYVRRNYGEFSNILAKHKLPCIHISIIVHLTAQK